MTRLQGRASDTVQKRILCPDQGEKTPWLSPLASCCFGPWLETLLRASLSLVAQRAAVVNGGPWASSPLLVCTSNRLSGSGSRLVIQGSFQNHLVFPLKFRGALIPSTKEDFLWRPHFWGAEGLLLLQRGRRHSGKVGRDWRHPIGLVLEAWLGREEGSSPLFGLVDAWVCVVFWPYGKPQWQGCLPGLSSASAPPGCSLGRESFQLINEAESIALWVPLTLPFAWFSRNKQNPTTTQFDMQTVISSLERTECKSHCV